MYNIHNIHGNRITYDLISKLVDDLSYSGTLEANLNDNFVQKCSRGLRIPKDSKNTLNIQIPEGYVNINHIIYDRIKKKERDQGSMNEGIPLYLPLSGPSYSDHEINREEPSNRGIAIIDYSI